MKTLVSSATALVLGAGIAGAATISDLSPSYFALSDIAQKSAESAKKSAIYKQLEASGGPSFSDYIAGGFDPGIVRNYANGFIEKDSEEVEAIPAALVVHLDEQLSLFQINASYSGAADSLASMRVGANDLGLDAMTATSASPFAQLFNSAALAAQAVASAISALIDTSPAEYVLLAAGEADATPYAALPLIPTAQVASAIARGATASSGGASGGGGGFGFASLALGGSSSASSDGASAGKDGTVSVHALASPDVAGLENTVAPVPVPAGLPLLAGAIGLLAIFRRRRPA